MDIRQAHTILTAATTLEQGWLGITMYPFDHAAPGNRDSYGDDYMTGCAEYTNSDNRNTRVYNIDLYPGPEQGKVTARVETGFANTGYVLLHESVSVASSAEEFDEEPARTIAKRITDVIREYEDQVERKFTRIVEREQSCTYEKD